MKNLARSLLHLLFTLFVACPFHHMRAAEPAAVFTVQPERCIALNRGQTCYQKLRFAWQTAAGARYCLHEDGVAAPLLCWNGSERNRYEHEFASDNNVVYALRHEGQADNLAQVEVEVAWVYRSNRNGFSRWRLF